MSDRLALVRLGEESDRAKRACERLATLSRSFESAVKRALPYLVRQKVAVVAQEAKPGLVHAPRADVQEREALGLPAEEGAEAEPGRPERRARLQVAAQQDRPADRRRHAARA